MIDLGLRERRSCDGSNAARYGFSRYPFSLGRRPAVDDIQPVVEETDFGFRGSLKNSVLHNLLIGLNLPLKYLSV